MLQCHSQILDMKQMINEAKKVQAGVTEQTSELIISKRLRVTENRLNQVRVLTF